MTLDFLLEQKNKDVLFYLVGYHTSSTQTRYDFRVVFMDYKDDNSTETCPFYGVVVYERNNDCNVYIDISLVNPLVKNSELGLRDIVNSLRNLIKKLIKDSRVRERLNSSTKLITKMSSEEVLLFKYKLINDEVLSPF